MLRRLIVAATCCLCFAGGQVQALGLGEIVVGSSLNQRFTAEIPFTSLTPEEAVNVRARLAENADFERAGLERASYLSSLIVDVITDDGSPRLVLSSDEIAREPLLSILIEVKTVGSGPRILRTYTVLLDPPGIGAAAPPPAAKPMALPGGSAAGADDEFFATAAEQQAPQKSAAPAAPTPRSGDRYGPVRSGETLESIAASLRPTGLTVDQVVLALYEANSSAFPDKNINVLRRGTMLAVPSASQMQATAAAKAHDRVQELRQKLTLQTTAAAPPITQSAVVPSSSSFSPSEVPPAEEEVEELDESAGAASESAGAEEDAGSSAETAGLNEDEAESASTPVEDASPTAESAAVSAGAENAAPEASAATVPPVTAVAPDASAAGETQDPGNRQLLWMLIAAALLLIGIAFLIVRAVRARRAQRAYDMASHSVSAVPKPRKGATGKVAVEPRSMRDELEALDRQLADQDRAGTSDTAVAANPIDPAATSRVAPSIDAVASEVAGETTDETEVADFESEDFTPNDPLAEAEFHLAYGLYDEAAAQLKQAVRKNPERLELRLKLAETYFAAGKTAEFVETAESLQSQLSADDWSKLAVMGRQLAPASALFAQTTAPAADLEVDLGSDEPLEAPLAPVERMDHGLDFRLEELELPTPQAEPMRDKPDSNLLEFDLGEFDLGTTPASPANQPKSIDSDMYAGSAGNFADLPDITFEDLEPLSVDELGSENATDGDDAGTKLDLARAYLEMGDMEMTRSLLDEVAAQGSEAQKRDAAVLRERLGG